MNKFTEETDEYAPITVFNVVNGVEIPVLTGVEFSITDGVSRPTVWTAAVNLGGILHVRVHALTAGSYRVWARITQGSEIAVVRAGDFIVI